MMKKNKIVIFIDSADEFIIKFGNKLIRAFSDKYDVSLYSFCHLEAKVASRLVLDEKLKYFAQAKDFRIYAAVLDYCQKNSIDYLYLPRLALPEYLLAELEVRPKLRTKISFSAFGVQDMYRSHARANVYRLLMNKKQVAKLFIHSIAGADIPLPAKIDQVLSEVSRKLIFLFDPIYEDRSMYDVDRQAAREKYGIKETEFIALYFGAMFFGKGVDILTRATEYLAKGIKYFVASNPKTINFNFSADQLKNNPRISYLGRFIPHEELGALFAASDLVVLPYRTTYLYGTSGVFVQAALARRLLVVPDFAPFKQVAQKYKLGLSFKAEDEKSLALSINRIRANNEMFMKQAQFDDYLGHIESWQEISEFILGNR